jgi:hypothetical protein
MPLTILAVQVIKPEPRLMKEANNYYKQNGAQRKVAEVMSALTP